jgi:hypothetical protein
MKYWILASLFTASTSAMACPDISGTYMSADGVPVKYAQQGCETLTRYIGDVDEKGAVTFPAAGMNFVMDGKPNCGIRNFCTSVTPAADSLQFKLNFEGGVATDEHGQCSQKGYDLSLDDDGNLVAEYQVSNCTDKFAGSVRKVSRKF